MKLMMQPAFSTCGQACIAMIAGKNVEEVIRDMKTDAFLEIYAEQKMMTIYRDGVYKENQRKAGKTVLIG